MKSLTEIRAIDTSRARRDFGWIAYCLLKAGENPANAADFARRHGQERPYEILRAAVSAGGLAHPEWAGSIAGADALQASFLASLRSATAFDAMLPDTVRMPIGISAVRVQTSAIEGATAGEGRAKPIYSLSFTAPILARFVSSSIVVLSNTVLDLSPAEAVRIIEQELVRGVTAATDRSFLALLAAGITPQLSSGSTPAKILADIEAALVSMELGTASRLYLIAHSSVVRSLALRADTNGQSVFPTLTINGGSLAGINVIASDYMPTVASPSAPLVLLVDASRIAAASEAVGLHRATHASLEMSDSPVHTAGGFGSPDTATGGNLVNLWQVNCTGFRAERWWSAGRLDDNAVAVISGASW
jgi:hypothetical protein